ncbi:unnamed protein product [Anisakis simplex]|uniref:Nuclear export mediator factor NEMF (inferred by orthology to a human protein) n=1 Tax=Anisakis simplex TaxID=6269 RepID=A0A0M3K3F0_ANISI|nr:unnamed protein product [Anisakis simplex]
MTEFLLFIDVMKNRFSTIDVFAVIHDLKPLQGLRVTNVYDVDSKTYLIRMHIPDEKCFIMFESGMRLHKSGYEWPKAQFPSSFSMKLRKHIKQKRLEHVQQLGIDRIVDLQFGSDERASHVIIELYDRGNVLLTDHQYTILNVLRPRTDKDTDVRFSVKQTYPIANARQCSMQPSTDDLWNMLKNGKKGDSLRRALAPLTHYGPALIEHSLRSVGIPNNAQEFHPYLFAQFEASNHREYATFSECVDEYFSKLESQKADQRALNAERDAYKKLENVKRDQQERIESLEMAQAEKREMAELIVLNNELVDKALLIIRSAIANQMSWEMIEEMRVKACEAGDPVASSIVGLNLNSNEMILSLRDPYYDESTPKKVPIDISLSAHQNSRKFHSEKKAAFEKEQKTISSSSKALKSAQLKTKETLATVRAKADVVKSRRQMWFEKFFWFVTSEHYLVIAGRDAQQNELLVKRYLRPGDIYVHADVRGASSVIIRNKVNGGEIPPKTLNEAGSMAVCYSSAWDAKVIASAWWVYHHQVSRTAPTGEYLTPGSFMIRGKKNFLPSCQLQMGFGLMFKLDEDSLERHLSERKAVNSELVDDSDSKDKSILNEATTHMNQLELENEVDIELDGGSDSEGDERNSELIEPELDEQFPDVQVSLSGIVNANGSAKEEEEYSIIQLGPTIDRNRAEKEREKEKLVEERKEVNTKKDNANKPLTKRQKHKAQKIKKKYGDQDEEESILRAQFLGSVFKTDGKKQQSGCAIRIILKVDSIETKRRTQATRKTEVKQLSEEEPMQLNVEAETVEKQSPGTDEQTAQPVASAKTGEEQDDDDMDIDETDLRRMGEEETQMLDSLTWKPLADDNLLYAVVVVAPYNTMLNFKYKVKLTPGTGKRGKAAKSAIALFQRDKSASTQELNLLRVLASDDQVSRNIPGKVRVSAPQLNKK